MKNKNQKIELVFVFFYSIYEHMDMREKRLEEKLNVLIEKELKKKYKIYCIKNDYNFSDRIRKLIEKDLNGEIK